MQKDIDLIYVIGEVTYNGIINRANFLDEMSHLAIWFPDCNFNALKLQELIPQFVSITISKTVVETQDVPFIVYTTSSSAEPQVLRLRRPWTIIWGFLKKYCDEAVKNSQKE